MDVKEGIIVGHPHAHVVTGVSTKTVDTGNALYYQSIERVETFSFPLSIRLSKDTFYNTLIVSLIKSIGIVFLPLHLHQ